MSTRFAEMPCAVAFNDDVSLPGPVLGPALLLPFARLAASWDSVRDVVWALFMTRVWSRVSPCGKSGDCGQALHVPRLALFL